MTPRALVEDPFMDAASSSAVSVKVRLAQKGLEAWVKLVPPIPCEPDEIRRALRANGVIDGYLDEAIQNTAHYPPKDEALVAQGSDPVPGEPARVEYFFHDDEAFRPMVEAGTGKVDFREGHVITTVTPGQVVARKIPATPGTPGRTVTGALIPAAHGKDLHILGGKNVELSEDKLVATSTVMGIPKVIKNRISVLPVFTVDDVNFKTGNINFQGSVVVRGSVHPGFSIKATEDIAVEGVIETAVLEAGGSIRVKGGVRSGSKLNAAGDIHVYFCDSNSELHAGGEIVVKNDALHSTLIARSRIVVGRALIGGLARASVSIQTFNGGTAAETLTRIELIQGGSLEEMESLRDQIEDLEIEIHDVTAKIQAEMAKPHGAGTAELQKLTPLKVTKNIQLTQLKMRLKELTEEESGMPEPTFTFKGDLYPGVVMTFSTQKGQKSQRVPKKDMNKTYRFYAGDIQP